MMSPNRLFGQSPWTASPRLSKSANGKPASRSPASTSIAAVFGLALLAGCATTKTPPPIVEQGAIGDADVVETAAHPASVSPPPNKGGLYRDPLVNTGHRKPGTASGAAGANGSATLSSGPSAEQVVAMNQSRPEQTASPNSSGLYSASHPSDDGAASASSPANSIVPPNMPVRPFQATVNSVYSVQKPLEQTQPQTQPQKQANQPIEPVVAPTPAPVVVKQRPASKAEILAGLAPDPKKVRTAPKAQQTTMPQQQMSPVPAQLQTSLPTAAPGMASSAGVTEMEKIEGAPGAQGMTKDSFIKKFLAKIRK
ncbi:hypothetical protein HGO34_09210 [Agrobacterium vitis]|uniref:Uncharacterized protein n=1 Tax=Agrobacterium vitis TaxID=373 RepID=A0AAE4WC49_AGRVI|nr:hypothetical protein [Agrobacterium vitis]MCF1496817.1 hypothetical protein [Allorhizobium sp. Av2]MCM2439893.1 hypothetical protein [Agrobacterium vitis]MUZ57210.1 hypothetical protein [Agrobacterium vitis]MVA65519.1 hypothetical protein [Agrobacterium vitis]MVA86544.1 hypothetical protein [Agrobacterium vitis]